jgi:hypothetical protein
LCFGRAELLEYEARGHAILEKIEICYIGGTPPELEEALWFEGRTAVVITPIRWLAWDGRQRPLIGVASERRVKTDNTPLPTLPQNE